MQVTGVEAGTTPAWRDAVRVVCIDMCSIYASAARRMLPHAVITVDLFHVVQLAVKATRGRAPPVMRARYGRRGRAGDPEYGIKSLLVRNLEHLSPARFAKIMDTLGRDRYGQEIAAAWIAKEAPRRTAKLRSRLTWSKPCQRQLPDRLFKFYDWCAKHDDIPQHATPRPDHLPLGGRDHRRRAHRGHQRHRRERERVPPG